MRRASFGGGLVIPDRAHFAAVDLWVDRMSGNVTGMVVDRIDSLVAQARGEMRSDQARFVQPRLAPLEHGRQFCGQRILCIAFRRGQAQPLDECGTGFADGKEQYRQPAP